ncbi:uncharacterized protein [Miscanthus floridulus]|uniref:uncharacterized protein n=1 Tax=Miscanthus floridulus TaxID=154761 RepID=UPI0034577D09
MWVPLVFVPLQTFLFGSLGFITDRLGVLHLLEEVLIPASTGGGAPSTGLGPLDDLNVETLALHLEPMLGSNATRILVSPGPEGTGSVSPDLKDAESGSANPKGAGFVSPDPSSESLVTSDYEGTGSVSPDLKDAESGSANPKGTRFVSLDPSGESPVTSDFEGADSTAPDPKSAGSALPDPEDAGSASLDEGPYRPNHYGSKSTSPGSNF